MGKITQEYGLDEQGYTQYNVDFLDLYLGVDNKLFLDYNKIFQGNSPIYQSMREDIQAFMGSLFNYLARGQNNNLRILLSGLHESDATHLGMSEHEPNGNSVGKELKGQILSNLIFLRRAFLNGVLEIDSIYFGIENIGPDRISDIITSIIKKRLIEFTHQQCLQYSIPTERLPVNKIFDSQTSTWGPEFVDLPVFGINNPVIFIPKDIVSSYAGISGTLDSFIRYGFNNFFKTSSAYKVLVRGEFGDLNSDLKRKEFNEYNKENNINLKAVSKTMLTELNNRFLVDAFSNVRRGVLVLTDEDLIVLIDQGFREAN